MNMNIQRAWSGSCSPVALCSTTTASSAVSPRGSRSSARVDHDVGPAPDAVGKVARHVLAELVLAHDEVDQRHVARQEQRRLSGRVAATDDDGIARAHVRLGDRRGGVDADVLELLQARDSEGAGSAPVASAIVLRPSEGHSTTATVPARITTKSQPEAPCARRAPRRRAPRATRRWPASVRTCFGSGTGRRHGGRTSSDGTRPGVFDTTAPLPLAVIPAP